MGDGLVQQTDFLHGLAGGVSAFADGVGDFIGLAESEAHASIAVAHDDNGAEAEATAAFDDLGAAVDEYDVLVELVLFVGTVGSLFAH